MRESCKYGSVRGAGSNPRPYRNQYMTKGGRDLERYQGVASWFLRFRRRSWWAPMA